MSALASSLSSVVTAADISVTSVTQPASFRRLLLWEAEPREGSWEPERRRVSGGSLFGSSRPDEESPCADADESAALFGLRKFRVQGVHKLHSKGHQVERSFANSHNPAVGALLDDVAQDYPWDVSDHLQGSLYVNMPLNFTVAGHSMEVTPCCRSQWTLWRELASDQTPSRTLHQQHSGSHCSQLWSPCIEQSGGTCYRQSL